jgi:hypothetical protein
MAEVIWPRAKMLAALLVLVFVVPAGADNPRTPDLDDFPDLRAPAAANLVLHTYGVGVQIYRWNGTSWDFVAPEAALFVDPADEAPIAIHFAGPTWETSSGSTVVGGVIARATPNPDAIPWLLLGAVNSEGPGLFDGVTYIQRLFTVGGNAPAEAGEFVGEVARVPYTAEYLFYRRGDN